MAKTTVKDKAGQATSVGDSVPAPNASVPLTGEQGREATCLSNQQPAEGCEETIRAVAYGKWEAAGCPAGDGLDFWLEAEREIIAERNGSSSAPG